MSTLEKELLKKKKLPPLETLRKEERNGLLKLPLNVSSRRTKRKVEYKPTQWNDYFDKSLDITVKNTNHVFRIYKVNPNKENGPLFIMHHGAGSSGLSFGITAKHIKELTQGECGVIAIDCRGHGATKINDFDNDFSLETLSNDLIHIIQQVTNENQDIILVGHSMGGSVVVNTAYKKILKNIIGVTVIDVVEGSAIDALSSMSKILNSRPKSFKSIEHAILWSLQSETLRLDESARLSIPALLEPDKDGRFNWITDLIKTQPFWTEWFTGLSDKFLNSGTAKLLLLAGTDRLDKPLIIGQMQGKFQLTIFPDSGHFVQEDTPLKTATSLVEFWKRNQRLILPPKVKV